MTPPLSLTVSVLPDDYVVVRLPADAAIPEWVWRGAIGSVTRTADEVSVVCRAVDVPTDCGAEGPWRVLMVAGPLDFALTGVLVALAAPLAEAGISIFALSTFDTDYLLVPGAKIEAAIQVLRSAGQTVDS